MSVKEFFRPTKWKVILSVILFLITILFIYLVITVRVYVPQGSKDPFLSNPIFWFAALPSLLMITLITSTEEYFINPIVTFVVIIALQLIYIYILPCFIVWLFNKMKRK